MKYKKQKQFYDQDLDEKLKSDPLAEKKQKFYEEVI